ncbi:uncharacterized protein BJ171DRAFT_275633 [Polychytrium aggregatum]|uniref:uncharacterized protein n=1 Tax=Polychytrium aggregatum TaxID=110093 RepID=UPI0022FDE7B7|nr:uncharacterized protein BJ171DRAFT_275633 [Polychytrium aggregatum]KAI9207441.1 hypothetical protein BJ171DRAFT_275633 [Polychytrium aggregatum]
MRFVTAFCAPGFMMTMGVSITLFTGSRKRIGWSDARILQHFAIRGFLLALINFWMTMSFVAPSGKPLLLTTVLFALGIDMILGAIVLLAETRLTSYLYQRIENSSLPQHDKDRHQYRLRLASVLFYLIAAVILAVVITAVTPVYDGATPPKESDFSFWYLLWVLPYTDMMGDGARIGSVYPPLAWLSVVLWGIFVGKVMTEFKLGFNDNIKFHTVLSVVLLAIFFPLRALGGFGNINPGLAHQPGELPWVAFFNLIKYPPDVAYLTWNLGANHLFLVLFLLATSTEAAANAPGPWSLRGLVSRVVPLDAWETIKSPNNPVMSYGVSSFFFYIGHFQVFFFAAWWMKIFGIEPFAPGLEYWVAWVAGMWLMFLGCRWYGQFKASQPADSIFRFF